MESEGRQERWFTDGAAALQRTLSSTGTQDPLLQGDFYACPLCLMICDRDAFERGVLSDEHVPPRSTGGRVLLLTCTRCNNTAGRTIEADAAMREATLEFMAGRALDGDLRTEFDLGGVPVRGTVNNANGDIAMYVVPRVNNPANLTEMTETLTTWVNTGRTGGSIGFTFPQRLSSETARLTWIRASYLAAFAAFGWRYALQEGLNPLRAQLAEPERSILPALTFTDPNAPSDRREMLIVEEPAQMRSLAVSIGHHTVFLPSIAEPRPVDEIAAGLAWYSALPASRRRCTRKQVPWPAEPQYVLDQ